MHEGIERAKTSADPAWTQADLAAVGIAALGFFIMLTGIGSLLNLASPHLIRSLGLLVQGSFKEAFSAVVGSPSRTTCLLSETIWTGIGLVLTQCPRAIRRLIGCGPKRESGSEGVSETRLREGAALAVRVVCLYYGMICLKSFLDGLQTMALYSRTMGRIQGGRVTILLMIACFIDPSPVVELMGLERGER